MWKTAVRSTERQGGGDGGRWNKDGCLVLTRWRPGRMVDLEAEKRRRQHGGTPSTSLTTGESTVEEIGMLGLGFNP
jgi:hypothetical protein